MPNPHQINSKLRGQEQMKCKCPPINGFGYQNDIPEQHKARTLQLAYHSEVIRSVIQLKVTHSVFQTIYYLR